MSHWLGLGDESWIMFCRYYYNMHARLHWKFLEDFLTIFLSYSQQTNCRSHHFNFTNWTHASHIDVNLNDCRHSTKVWSETVILYIYNRKIVSLYHRKFIKNKLKSLHNFPKVHQVVSILSCAHSVVFSLPSVDHVTLSHRSCLQMWRVKATKWWWLSWR